MVDLIRKSDVCVADLTDNRPNVFFEYGWRRSTGRPVIALIQKGERIPYDVDDFHIVQYRVEEPAAAMREIEAFLRQRGFSSLDIEVAAERQDQVSKICEYIRRIQPERIDVLQLTCYRMVEELFDTLEKCANLTVRLLLMHPEAVSRYSLGPHHQEEVKGAERRIRKAAYQTVRAESPT
jgi:hypothetical protein